MVRVKFLQDFRGKLTKERFYLTGEIAEFDGQVAQALLDEKRVTLAEVEETEEAKPKRQKRKTE